MIEELSRRGFRAVVNLSRKGELDQVLNPEQEEIEVTSFGMRYVHLPVSILSLKPTQADEFIEELEGERRGLYAGAAGYFSYDGSMDTCIAIRTMLVQGEHVYVQAGAGIVADSDPGRIYLTPTPAHEAAARKGIGR